MLKTIPLTTTLLLITAILISGACTSSKGTDEPTQMPTRTVTDTTIDLAGFYESTVHGFSIHYPPEWDTESGGTGQAIFTIHNPGNSCVIQVFIESEWQTSSLDKLADTAFDDIRQKLTAFNLLFERKIQLGDTMATVKQACGQADRSKVRHGGKKVKLYYFADNKKVKYELKFKRDQLKEIEVEYMND